MLPLISEDLGQKNFGPTLCKTCGFVYHPGADADEALHKTQHDCAVNGARMKVFSHSLSDCLSVSQSLCLSLCLSVSLFLIVPVTLTVTLFVSHDTHSLWYTTRQGQRDFVELPRSLDFSTMP